MMKLPISSSEIISVAKPETARPRAQDKGVDVQLVEAPTSTGRLLRSAALLLQ